jgi:hypothetical protein
MGQPPGLHLPRRRTGAVDRKSESFGQKPWLTAPPPAAQAFCPPSDRFTSALAAATGPPGSALKDAKAKGDAPMRRTSLSLLALAALALGACGYSTGDRAASGGLLGAGAGAGVSALTGGSVGTGALIGGAAGAAGGALTSGRDVNLGRPAWR